jgi:NAD(P)-dependent dehydrogenase (short-subunit alcohol dehydrogenase family)
MSTSPLPQSPFRLDNRHALVTGGASGIGEATARELARAGAHVYIADINLPAAESLAYSICHSERSEGPAFRVSAIHLDVTNPASIAAAVAQIPRLDILVNNAGIGHVGSIETTEPEDFDRLLNVNVRSVYLVTRAFLSRLLKIETGSNGKVGQGFSPDSPGAKKPGALAPEVHVGTIINICSVAAQVGIKQRFAYCTSKGAVLSMTRQLAVEYPKTLRVNAICPGTVETPFVEGYLEKFHKDNKEETRAELRARQPIGRLGRPEEVAAMVRYLASDEAAFINGAAMAIDGGWTAA